MNSAAVDVRLPSVSGSVLATAFRVRRRGWLALALLFFLILGLRFVYVSLFAQSTPYWDQWDSEADLLLRPWVEGTWRFADLFNAHNEHRIAFSRLLSITLFEANDRQWDNLVEAYANAALFACAMTMLLAALCRSESNRNVRVAVVAAAVVLSALPFEWENILVGFQSAFYFTALLAIAAIALVSFRRLDRSTLLLELAIVGAGLFTLASGAFAAPAAMAVVLMRAWRDSLRPPILLAFGAVFGFIFAVGIVLIPDLPSHHSLRAVGVVEHLNALAVALMWPLPATGWPLLLRIALALAVWTPALAWGAYFLRRRSAHASDLFAAGVAAWVCMLACAMAHSRGHGINEVASRYMALLSFGTLVNVYFAVRLLRLPRSSMASLRWARSAAMVLVVVVAAALIRRTPLDMRQLREELGYMKVQTENTFAYVATGDFRHLQKQFRFIPYPDAQRLRSLLDNPTIRAMLPHSIRAPLRLEAPAEGFSPDGLPPSLSPPEHHAALGSYGRPGASLRYTSSTVHTSFPYLQFLTFGGNSGEIALLGDGATAETATRIPLRGESTAGWNGSIVAAPGPVFRIEAVDGGANRRLAFAAPLELGRLSRWALRIQATVRGLAGRTDSFSGGIGHAAATP